MARVDNFDGFSFVHWGHDVAISPHGAAFGHTPTATVPMSAVHAVVFAAAAPGRASGTAANLAELLLGAEAGAFTSAEPHPSVRRDGDHVVVTGPDLDARDAGQASEVSHRIPLSALRSFTYGMFTDAIVSTVELMCPDQAEQVALALLSPKPAT